MFPDDLATGINDPYGGTVMAKERQLNVPDLGVLVAMAKSDAEGQKRFAPFWNIYLADNPLSGKPRGQIHGLQKLGGRVYTE